MVKKENKIHLKKISNFIVIVLIFLFIIEQLAQTSLGRYLYTIGTAIVIILSLIYSKGLPKIFGTVMILIGTVVLIFQQVSIDVWIEAITKNLPLVCLVIFVPILGIPIGLGNYHTHLAQLTNRLNEKPQWLYLFISGLFTLIGPITNLGSLYIIHSMLDKLKLPNNLLGRVYVRGFTSVHTWAPYYASVFLVVYSLGIPIYQFLPYGFLLSIFQVITAVLVFKFIEMRYVNIQFVRNENYTSTNKVYELFLVLVLLMGFIFLFEPIIPINASVLISLIVLFFSFIWSLYLKIPNHFTKEVNRYRKKIFPDRASEISLLLIAGFFGVVLSKTPIGHYLNVWWVLLSDISIFLLILLTIITIALFSFLGVHQIVTISAIIATISYEQLGIHVITMAMMLLSSWAVSTTVSPVTPVITVISNLLKENVYTIILRWNLLYAIVITIIHSTVIYFTHLFWLS